MADNLKITVASPVFNGAATLQAALESVVSQTYHNIEYLLIDGASTDDSLMLIQEYANRYPDIIKYRSEPDKGIYDAMNKIQQIATGDFLILLGCDDVLYNENVIDEFTKWVSDKNSVYYGDVMAKDCGEIWYGLFSTEKLLMQNISHQAIFYPKKIYKHLTYNLKYKLFADWDYNLRAWSLFGEFKRIELIVTLYAQTGASGNNNHDKAFLQDRSNLVKQYFGSRYSWLVEMQKLKQKLIGKTDLRKVKGYIFPKIK